MSEWTEEDDAKLNEWLGGLILVTESEDDAPGIVRLSTADFNLLMTANRNLAGTVDGHVMHIAGLREMIRTHESLQALSHAELRAAIAKRERAIKWRNRLIWAVAALAGIAGWGVGR